MLRLRLNHPFYNFLSEAPNLETVASAIDSLILENFGGREIVLRAIQSQKHKIGKDALLEYIEANGTDYYQTTDDVGVIYGKKCLVDKESNLSLSILEGFHKFKPMSLEKPQYPADIWLIYNLDELDNIKYIHHHYSVEAHDKYAFKNPQEKQKALLGIMVIDS